MARSREDLASRARGQGDGRTKMRAEFWKVSCVLVSDCEGGLHGKMAHTVTSDRCFIDTPPRVAVGVSTAMLPVSRAKRRETSAAKMLRRLRKGDGVRVDEGMQQGRWERKNGGPGTGGGGRRLGVILATSAWLRHAGTRPPPLLPPLHYPPPPNHSHCSTPGLLYRHIS